MESAILQTPETDRLRAGPSLVRNLVDEMSGLDRVLARRESSFGTALEEDLFPDGAPGRVLPTDVRHALATRLERALRTWMESPAGSRGAMDDVVKPLRAIAEGVRTGDAEDELLTYLFPAGVPSAVSTVDLLRAFRHAASREQRALVRLVSLVPAFEGWDTLIEHEIAGRLVLVTKLWVVAVRWFALGAARVDAAHVRSFQQLLEKWTKIEAKTRELIDA